MRQIPLPKFHESLLNEEWYRTEFEQKLEEARGHPFFERYLKLGMREGILSDMASALGRVHDVIVEAAKPNLIGREIIDTRTTTEALERFILGKKSRAYKGVESGTIEIGGERYSYKDIEVNVILKDGVEWSLEFAEDAKWNVMNRQLEELGRSIAQKETEEVISLYAGISASNLATGAELAGGGTAMSWSKCVSLWDAVESEDFHPDTLILHHKQASQLFTATEFINSQYLPSEQTELARGLIGQALTMKIFKSSLCTNGTAHAVDKTVAAILLMRRDIQTAPYEDPKNGVFGIVATERIGLGSLRTKAVARMTNIKTSL